MIEENFIIEEVRRTREQMLANHNGDLNLLVDELQHLAANRARAGQSAVAPDEHPNVLESTAAKKVG